MQRIRSKTHGDFRHSPLIRNSLLIGCLMVFSFSPHNLFALDAPDTVMKEVQSDQSGIITYIDGNAQKKKKVDPEWLTAHVQSKVVMGEKIKTLEKSRAELEIDWDTIIRLSENTVVDFVKLFKDVNNKFDATDLQVEDGEIWASIDSLDENSTFSIGDSLAKAEIRGTTFRYRHSQSGSRIKVYEGAVAVKSAHVVSGPKEVNAPYEVQGPHEVLPPSEVTLEQWSFTIGAMQELLIPEAGKKPQLRSFDASESDEKSEWVQWNKERDRIRLQKRKGEEDRLNTSNE